MAADKQMQLAPPTLKELDNGFYETAAGEGKPGINLLAEKDPSPPEHVDLVHARKLQDLGVDPVKQANRCRELRDWSEKAATLERHLIACTKFKDAGGLRHAAVKDFFSAVDSAVLFPAWIESQVQLGRLRTAFVEDIVFETENVDTTSVIVLYFNDSEAERSLKKISEGSELPVIKVTKGEQTINLYKYGATLQVSYETLAQRRVDAFGTYVQRVGVQIGIDAMDQLMHIAIAGDGSTFGGTAESNSTDVDVTTAGTILSSDMARWFVNPEDPYLLDFAVMGKTDQALLMDLAEFKDPDVAASLNQRGFPSYLNMTYRRWTGGVTGSSYVDRLIVGFDTRSAMRRLLYGSMLTEADKLITRQVERTAISETVGYQKWDANAVQVLDTNEAL